MKRVVITGLGILSSIGNNLKEVLNSLKSGNCGITFSQKLKDYGLRSNVWGNIKLDISGLINKKKNKFMNDASIYTFLSMEQAIKDSKLKFNMISNNRTGIIVGSAIGYQQNQIFKFNNVKNKYFNKISPYLIIKSMSSNISACLSTFFKIKGVNYSINSACSTSAHCIGNAVEIIQLGKQDIIFAGGGEELNWKIVYQFDAMKVLSIKYNKNPKKASRAYDINRDGFVISGGGGIVVVEELQHALNRNAYIYAEIVGYCATSDGKSMIEPSGEGAFRCMKIAIQNLNIPIDYINTHGTSTKIGDIKELLAIYKLFGNNHPKLSSTKSMTGHSIGASGVHELIFTILMLKYNFIAPSINIEVLDNKIKKMNIVTKTKKHILNTAMSNSFGFGGTNATIVIKKY